MLHSALLIIDLEKLNDILCALIETFSDSTEVNMKDKQALKYDKTKFI